jgi:hypothetical protein
VTALATLEGDIQPEKLGQPGLRMKTLAAFVCRHCGDCLWFPAQEAGMRLICQHCQGENEWLPPKLGVCPSCNRSVAPTRPAVGWLSPLGRVLYEQCCGWCSTHLFAVCRSDCVPRQIRWRLSRWSEKQPQPLGCDVAVVCPTAPAQTQPVIPTLHRAHGLLTADDLAVTKASPSLLERLEYGFAMLDDDDDEQS